MKVGKTMVEIRAPESAIARVQVLHDVLCDVGPLERTPVELRVRCARRKGWGDALRAAFSSPDPSPSRTACMPLPGAAADPQAYGGPHRGGCGGMGPVPNQRDRL